MSRFATLTTLNVGDALPDAWVDEVKALHDWIIVSGGNLASAATINPTAGYHNLTGSTQVNTITDASGPVAGQTLLLKIAAGCILGVSGNIVTPSGAAQYYPTGDLVQLVYDGTNWIVLDTKEGGYTQYFDIVSTAALSTIFTQSISANLLGTLGALEILIEGRYTNNTGGTKTLGVQVSFGGTVMWGSISAIISTSTTNRAMSFRGVLSNQNVTNAQQLAGMLSLGGAVNGSVGGVGDIGQDFGFGTVGGISAADTTAAQTLLIQVQHSASSATLELKGTAHVNILA